MDDIKKGIRWSKLQAHAVDTVVMALLVAGHIPLAFSSPVANWTIAILTAQGEVIGYCVWLLIPTLCLGFAWARRLFDWTGEVFPDGGFLWDALIVAVTVKGAVLVIRYLLSVNPISPPMNLGGICIHLSDMLGILFVFWIGVTLFDSQRAR